ncbi:serine/threonine-protein kinase [Caenimonas sp. SL110]|uniref:serine/threonine protein kinase n=1 Tax=Caenimonas sp. SL110 TaxID=1450524 RepID=UPI000652E4B8|nr:serine/threonine-protein kinase [Caenimonas sp. SL110]
MSLKKLGRYDLIRVLGKGAMGIVYEGKDPNLDRRVAIKTVKVENLSEEAAAEYEARFRTEARSAARLQHPNIVSVYDSDRDGDIAFLVMEFIQGDDLKHHLDKGIRYSLEQSLKMIRDLLSALDYAHKQGIVHRDIKPANLLIEPGGRVKLTDFGVARIQDSGEATRTQGSMVGTLKYMSPEQVQGQKIDARADLFSVGVVLYQLLTDKRPFDGDNDFSIIHQIIGHTPAAPSSFNARLPPAIDAVVARALAKNRDERFATARDFASALQSAIRRAEDATVVPPADPGRRQEGPSNINPSVTTGSVLTSPSTVTQEVELVYWKDIKDSVDPEEFEGFLSRFPAGIYADLARRRLRKLTGGTLAGDQTVLGGILPGSEQDLDATRMRPSTFTAPLVVAQPPATAGAATTGSQPERDLGPSSESSTFAQTDFTSTQFEPRSPEGGSDSLAQAASPPAQLPVPPHDSPALVAASPAASPEPTSTGASVQAPAPDSLVMAAAAAKVQRALKKEKEQEKEADKGEGEGRDRGAGVTAQVRKKPPLAVIAGIGAVAVIAIAAFLMSGKKTAPVEVAAAASAASRASADVPVAAVTTPAAAVTTPAPAAAVALPASASAATVAASAASAANAAAAKASAARRVASAPKPRIVTPTPLNEAPRNFPVAPAAPMREESRVASGAVVLNGPNPVEQCKDKMFVSREFCLAEHCDKAVSRNHPLCVKRREDIKLREESKVRQGPQ